MAPAIKIFGRGVDFPLRLHAAHAFTQRMMDSPEPPKVFTDFWTNAYGAME